MAALRAGAVQRRGANPHRVLPDPRPAHDDGRATGAAGGRRVDPSPARSVRPPPAAGTDRGTDLALCSGHGLDGLCDALPTRLSGRPRGTWGGVSMAV